MENLKKTPLHSFHKSKGARLVQFAGWEMPIQYQSIVQEHVNTREKAGLFDVSHMGEIFIEGDKTQVLELLEKVTPNHVSNLKPNRVRYNAILNQDGGLVDDVTIYRLQEDQFLICSNAANYKSVYSFLCQVNTHPGVQIHDRSSEWHQIAIQGPVADKILSGFLERDLTDIGYFHYAWIPYLNESILISRTGYTGEDGFEIYSTPQTGITLWNKLLSFGEKDGLTPVGLGARDTLRMEAKYPLYGHELNAKWSPVESGLAWIVKEKQIEYFCYEHILQQKQQGTEKSITGILLQEPGVIRSGYKIFSADGKEIGHVTSGSYSPILKHGIGMVYIRSEFIQPDKPVQVEIRGNLKQAKIVTGNFVTGSVKRKSLK